MEPQMLLKTILNQLEKYSSFVFTNVFFTKSYHHYEFESDTVIVEIEPRKNGITICSGCGKPGKIYDKLDLRLFQYVPIWIFAVYFAYTMRRVSCKTCGVTVEMVPWAEGKEQLTRTFKWFLSQWAKKLPWEDVARTFNTSGQCSSIS